MAIDYYSLFDARYSQHMPEIFNQEEKRRVGRIIEKVRHIVRCRRKKTRGEKC